MRKLGIICGSKAEVACFHRAAQSSGISAEHYLIQSSGSSRIRAQKIAEKMVEDGATFLLSYGIAGGLDPKFPVGDVVFSNHVITQEGENFGTPPQQAKPLTLRSGALNRQASVVGVDQILHTPEEKARVFKSTRAAIADMESHAVARLAREKALPFFVLRSISDTAQDTLPAFVGAAIDKDGNPKLGPVLWALLKNPFILPALLTLKAKTDKALKALEEATGTLLPHLYRQ